MALLRTIHDLFGKALRDMARRAVPAGRGEAGKDEQLLAFLAEKLIALAAGAAFVVAPMCLVLIDLALPGTYGSAAAIALAHLAIPFLALGWLSISRKPWSAGIFALASWSALAGTLIAVSPVIALTSGLVLFMVAGGRGTASRVEAIMAAPAAEAPRVAEETPDMTQIELADDGRVVSASGKHAGTILVGRPFVDRVHLADRIAFLAELANIAGKRGARSELSARIDLGSSGQPQAFRTMLVELAGDDAGSWLALRKPADRPAAVADAEPGAEKRFLATVSHELRTPLNSIIGFSDILRRDLFGSLANDRQREYVNLIHSSGVHLLSVVNTILDVSKLNAGTYPVHREAFDLDAVVRECVSMLRPQADAKRVTVIADLPDTIDQADADRRAIKQIVINLLSNAIKFTDADGSVRIATQKRDNGFALRVRDTGIGMSNAELDRIGTPFAQLDNAYTRSCEGTGLGLTVVAGLVQLHGGSLDVKSEPGEGTEVVIFVPAAADSQRISQTNAKGEEYRIDADAPVLAGNRSDVHDNTVRLAG